MTKQTPDDKNHDDALPPILKTSPLPHKAKADGKVSQRPLATKAEHAAFKRKDKGVSKPAMRKH